MAALLAALPAPRVLGLASHARHCIPVHALAGLTALTELEGWVAGDLEAALPALAGLQRLVLDGCRQLQGLRHISRLTALRCLEVGEVAEEAAVADALPSLPQLTRLRVWEVGAPGDIGSWHAAESDTWRQLAAVSGRLASLALSDVGLCCVPEAVAGLSALTFLDLRQG